VHIFGLLLGFKKLTNNWLSNLFRVIVDPGNAALAAKRMIDLVR
tara:strand:+ start:425 stop:556 length:132 start_codon:yes stop_codon:yes gene_type:complete